MNNDDAFTPTHATVNTKGDMVEMLYTLGRLLAFAQNHEGALELKYKAPQPGARPKWHASFSSKMCVTGAYGAGPELDVILNKIVDGMMADLESGRAVAAQAIDDLRDKMRDKPCYDR